MTTTKTAPRRDWTNVGARYTTPERREQVECAIAGLTWQPFVESMSLPMSPGLGIQEAIRELSLPRVSALAWDGALSFPAPNDESEYPGLYGIEANYANGRARIYLIDNGTEIVPVCADFWAADRG